MATRIKDMDNGDVSQHQITHFCVQGSTPCCQSSAQALQKTQQAFEQRFNAGYEPPLLYRFKHTVPANHYLEDVGFI